MSKIYLIFFIILFSNKLYALNNEVVIKFKIGREIITNLDIKNEKNYLIFLRPKLSSLPDKELLKISENSLIREIIKKRELDRVYRNLENEKLMKDIKDRIFKYKNAKNEQEFINLTKQKGI